jgi:poly(3-hydroxyalkanoate) synthetase
LIKSEIRLDQNKNNEEKDNKNTRTKTAIDLKKITVPLLNIVGTEDDLVPA